MLVGIKRATGEDLGQEDGPGGRSQRSTTCGEWSRERTVKECCETVAKSQFCADLVEAFVRPERLFVNRLCGFCVSGRCYEIVDSWSLPHLT
jgi:hypothetical protein